MRTVHSANHSRAFICLYCLPCFNNVVMQLSDDTEDEERLGDGEPTVAVKSTNQNGHGRR